MRVAAGRIPAQFTTISTDPNASSAPFSADSTDATSVTSTAPVTPADSSLQEADGRSRASVLIPCARNVSTIAAPIPPEAPTTTACCRGAPPPGIGSPGSGCR